MSDLAIAPVPGSLADYGDPAAFVELALTRAKDWLVEAIDHGDIDGIVELKSQAEAIRVYSAQKQLGKEAELNAAEIVRRAERGLGLAIRKGQERGAIRSTGRHAFPTGKTISPSEYFSSGNDTVQTYAMTDSVNGDQFEEAIEAGRAEQNLSRSNVLRKIRGESGDDDKLAVARQMAAVGNSTRQIAAHLGYGLEGMRGFLKRHGIDVPADRSVGRSHNLKSVRIVDGAVGTVNGIGTLFDQIIYTDLPVEKVQGWLEVLNESIRSLTTLRNRLKETSQP